MLTISDRDNISTVIACTKREYFVLGINISVGKYLLAVMAGSIAVLPDNWTYVKRRTRLEEEATLIVGDFENEMKISKPGEKIESRIFILGGNPFKIDVYPNGENEESKNHVSIFLQV